MNAYLHINLSQVKLLYSIDVYGRIVEIIDGDKKKKLHTKLCNLHARAEELKTRNDGGAGE